MLECALWISEIQTGLSLHSSTWTIFWSVRTLYKSRLFISSIGLSPNPAGLYTHTASGQSMNAFGNARSKLLKVDLVWNAYTICALLEDDFPPLRLQIYCHQLFRQLWWTRPKTSIANIASSFHCSCVENCSSCKSNVPNWLQSYLIHGTYAQVYNMYRVSPQIILPNNFLPG